MESADVNTTLKGMLVGVPVNTNCESKCYGDQGLSKRPHKTCKNKGNTKQSIPPHPICQ